VDGSFVLDLLLGAGKTLLEFGQPNVQSFHPGTNAVQVLLLVDIVVLLGYILIRRHFIGAHLGRLTWQHVLPILGVPQIPSQFTNPLMFLLAHIVVVLIPDAIHEDVLLAARFANESRRGLYKNSRGRSLHHIPIDIRVRSLGLHTPRGIVDDHHPGMTASIMMSIHCQQLKFLFGKIPQ